MKYVIVIDMQNDFISKALGSEKAQIAAKNAEIQLNSYKDENTRLIYTLDTHYTDYLNTLEGKNLPVEHCIKDTEGWKLVPEVTNHNIKLAEDCAPYLYNGAIEKNTFGSIDLINYLSEHEEDIDSIDVFGVCTDICVVSNVMLIKAAFPEIEINVIEKCCAGVTPERHDAAIAVMESCQINII